MKRKQINYLGFVSLLSLLALLGFGGNRGFFGFLGFLAYAKYFTVLPDELFMENLRKSCTVASMAQLLSLLPLMFGFYMFMGNKGIGAAFAMAFVVFLIVFSVILVYYELKESKA